MASYEERTVAELREICRQKGITGMSKARKDDIIETLRSHRGHGSSSSSSRPKKEEIFTEMDSVVTREYGEIKKVETTVRVSAGAASVNEKLVGKSVGQVAEIYKHILNINASDINAVVNGDKVSEDYRLQDGDELEFLKPVSKKG